ncbi:MAG: carbohydrate porin [Hyphomicrobiales bacterium]
MKSRMRVAVLPLLVLLFCVHAGATSAQENSARARLEAAASASLGGPQSASAQLEEDRLRRQEDSRSPGLDAFFDPFEQDKQTLKEQTGLDIGLDYQLLYQHSTNTVSGNDEATAGHARMLGNWALFDQDGPNQGSLVFIIENRHRLGTKTSPAGLGSEIGYIGLTGTTFGDSGSSLSVANWAQSIDSGRAGVVIGRIDPTDYIDILGYVNPRTTFSNLSVLFNPVVVLPDPGYGVGAGVYLTDQVYTIGMVSDANGSLTKVRWFPGGAELFKYAQLGWTPARDQRYLTNIHIAGFHVDKRKDAGVDESYGIMLSGNTTFDNELMLFGRLGFSKGEAPIANAAGTIGFMWRPGFYDDLIGAAVNIAKPAVSGLDTQTSIEAFYRFDASDNLAITADVQWLINPALDPGNNSTGVFGLRARLNL